MADFPFVSLVPADSGQPQIKLYYFLKEHQTIKTKKTSAQKPRHATRLSVKPLRPRDEALDGKRARSIYRRGRTASALLPSCVVKK